MRREEAYAAYCQALADRRLPAALVDLDALETNIHALLAPVRAGGKTLRIATKSLRCVELIRRIQERAGPLAKGLMCYAVAEAAFLFERGFDDLLVAYPTLQTPDMELAAQLNRSGATVRLAVDDAAQVEAIARRARLAEVEVPLLVDLDASLRPLGGAVHLGVRRSPIHSVEAAVALARTIVRTSGVRLDGLLAYEAQIAGLSDASPFTPWTNPAKRLVRTRSRSTVAALRAQVARAFRQADLRVEVFNGGGTGSLNWASQEKALTELSAGSGFLDSHLFDYYRHLALQPAAFFALQITRRPGPGFVTCHGGGYVASGEAGLDRLPRPWLPRGLELTRMEGAGEVQTPLTVPRGIELSLGAPVFFRHAKAGELAEHFSSYLLVRGGEVVAEVPTYRGEGAAFV